MLNKDKESAWASIALQRGSEADVLRLQLFSQQFLTAKLEPKISDDNIA